MVLERRIENPCVSDLIPLPQAAKKDLVLV